MKIEEKIKELLRTKAKIDAYREVISSVEKSFAELDKEHAGLADEFRGEVINWCNSRIEFLGNLEQPRTAPPAATPPQKSPEEFKGVDPRESEDSPEPDDPLRFALKYRALDGKRVVVDAPEGPVLGVVCGLISPHIIVETDTGYTVSVSPKKVREVSDGR